MNHIDALAISTHGRDCPFYSVLEYVLGGLDLQIAVGVRDAKVAIPPTYYVQRRGSQGGETGNPRR